jgi:hypothetical protein
VLARPVLDTERRLRPWLRSLRVRPRTVVAAFAFALTMPSSALAAGAGVVAGVVGRTPPLALGAGLGVTALVVSGAVAAWARIHRHQRGRLRNPIFFVLGVLAIALATLAAAAW